jgi:NitT/TauT family transport system substrate-binding protein
MRAIARRLALVLLAIALAPAPVAAEKLTVSQYGRIISTLPWAVALKKGMFKEAGIQIDDIIAGAGGGTSLRNMLAGDLPFAEIATPAALAGLKAGVDLKIVMASSDHVGELSWAALPGKGIRTVKDLAGKKVAYTNPKSTTEMVLRMILEREGLTGKVELLSIGGLGAGLTALAQGAVDAAPLTDPPLTLQKERYQVLFAVADLIPKLTWSVGVTTREFAEKQPAKVRALVAIHRRAVDFIYANRAEAAAIYAEVWQTDRAQADRIIPKYFEMRHWSRGDFDRQGLDAIARGLLLVGELDRPVDWKAIIDQSFLPEDLRTPF